MTGNARMAGRAVLVLAALLVGAATPAQAQILWPWKHKSCPVCPEAPAEITAPPKVLPPQPTPEPAPSPITTAALEFGGVSLAAPNMFGDQFGGNSRVVVQTRDNFTFRGDTTLTGVPFRATFTNLTPVTTQRGVIIPPGNMFSSQETFVSPGDAAPAFLTMLDNPAVRALIVANMPPGTTTLEVGEGTRVGTPTSIIPSQYDIFYEYLHEAVLDLPNPSRGGVVGRAKISEDNYPIPRDRLIFNYDYFNNTQLTQNDWDVNRFTVGVEKTFLNQLLSAEVRLPFACTLNSNITQGAESSNAELGNLRMILRGLLWSGERVFVGAGLGIDLPTADDTRAFLADGTPFAAIENEAVILNPFFGALFLPTPRLFVQSWIAMEFDVNGNPVHVNTGRGLTPIGRIYDAATLVSDVQLGYWIIRSEDPTRLLQGLAPFIELHHGTTVENARLASSDGITVGSVANRVDELNLSAGWVTELRSNLVVSVGAVAPLRQGDDRGFDYQVGLRANWFYGPTARQRRFAASNF